MDGKHVIVVMPPYNAAKTLELTPSGIPPGVADEGWLGASEEYEVVLGSRILGTSAQKGGMLFYKYVSNRFLTTVDNILLGMKLSEYHTATAPSAAAFWKPCR